MKSLFVVCSLNILTHWGQIEGGGAITPFPLYNIAQPPSIGIVKSSMGSDFRAGHVSTVSSSSNLPMPNHWAQSCQLCPTNKNPWRTQDYLVYFTRETCEYPVIIHVLSRCLSTIWWWVKDRVLAQRKLEFISRRKL